MDTDVLYLTIIFALLASVVFYFWRQKTNVPEEKTKMPLAVEYRQTKSIPDESADFKSSVIQTNDDSHGFESSSRTALILNSIHDGVIATDVDGRIQLMNPIAQKMTGWPVQEALQKSVEVVFDIVHPEQGNALQNPVRDVLVTGQPIETRHYVLLLARDGVRRQILTSAAPILSPEGEIDGVVLVCHDVTDLYQSRQALAASEQTFRHVTDATPVMLWMMDAERQINFANRAARKYFGVSGNLKDLAFFSLVHEKDRVRVTNAWNRVSQRENSFVQLEYRMQDASEQFRWFYTVVQSIHDEQGQLVSYVGSSLDISERKKAETQIERLAYYDSLTNLPNRRLLLDRLGRALTAVTREKLYGAVYYLDLDNFKTLNDSMGHATGDQLLKQVGERIRSTLRAEDTVARFGGDEFVVLSGQMETHERDAVRNARLLGEKVRSILSKPYQLGDYEYHATPSIGITLFTHTTDGVDNVLMQADAAMYRAKSEGRNRVCFYEPHMQDSIVQQLDMEKRLREAIQTMAFALYYQPQVNASGEITGAEALLRWPQQDGHMLTPKSFLAVAEETGQVIPIGYWVLQTACEQLKQWENLGLPEYFTLSVNISHRQFIQQDFVHRMEQIIQNSGVQSGRLQIEITEHVVRDSMEAAIEKLTMLKNKLNIQCALDDFGTGFSSLTHLRRFPLDEVKIERSFIRDLSSDPDDALLAEVVLEIGRKLGVRVLAEGVETADQHQFLADHGCDSMQGFLFGKPVTAEVFEKAYLIGLAETESD